MSIHPTSILSFFNVCTDDFLLRLEMMPALLSHFPADDLPETLTFTTTDPKDSRTWHVAVDPTDQGYYFTHGWSEVAKDLNLCLGDFLILWLLSPRTLQIVPCGPNCIPKPLNLNTHQPSKHEKGSGLSFVATIKNHNKYILCLPRRFDKKSGLEEKERVTLVDPEGREWTVEIRARKEMKSGETFRVDLGRGWSDFRKANELGDGVECTFRLIEADKIQVHFDLSQ